MLALLDAEPLDLVVVIGGYNSSNTGNLARLCAERVPTFHIAEPACLHLSRRNPSSRRSARPSTTYVPEQVTRDWFPRRPRHAGPDGGGLDPE